MLDDFSKLKARTQQLGNHHRKYIHFISAKKDLLIERLEESGTIDEVHFWSAAPDQAAEMEALLRLGKDEKEKLAFLGCYFAFQILNLNLHAVDVLRLGLSTREDRLRVYRDFMLQMGRDLRRLSAAYMEKLLDLFLPAAERPNFVICSVGTRADQDDLDVGIVDDGSERRETFNRAIGFMQREMLRRAIPLHFHLSEHVGEKGFAASIDEYVRLLSRGIQDFIIISEMLGASPILGSDALYSRFTREVTDRYFFDRFADNRFHEGYLRGIMGEVRSLLLRKLSSDSINPKRDALRIIKGLISALKTVHGIDELNAWHILDELRTKDPAHGEIYDELEDALSFVEAFRFLYQILEVEEEEILLAEEGSRAQLEAVAELMGYRDLGVVRAYDHLLIHYHEHVQATRAAAKVLLADLKQHLERISVFSGIIRNRGEVAAEGKNLSLEFVRALRFFRGTRYWDDVMTPMETDLALLRHFVDDFNNLFVEDRKVWIQRYAKWGEVTSLAVIRLLVILYQKRRKVDSLRFFHDFSAAFIDRVSRCPDVIPRLTAVFEHYPRLINDFLVGLREDDKLRFAKIFEGQVWSEEVDALRQSLRYFCRLHCSSSHYFKRFFQRIVTRYAEYVAYFNHTERLQVISKG
ncbi:MAG: hypothetical protein GY842_14090, partial [bacterium]|nr:hypothetical protein [bacterium]